MRDGRDVLRITTAGLCWGLLGFAGTLLVLWLRERSFRSGFPVALLHALGAILWGFVWAAFCVLVLRRTTRFTVARAGFAWIALVVGTLVVDAFLFSQAFRIYFAQWHEPFGTRVWVLQTLFTSASAIYQYLVLGSRILLPVALPVGLIFALWAVRSPIETRGRLR